MRTLRWIIPIALALITFVAAYFYFRRDLPRSSLTALRSAERFELLSLNPHLSRDDFHNHEILGRTTITDPATRQQLTDALRSAARQGDPRRVMACFNPRHGIRVTRAGQVTDFVICFECRWLRIHRDGKPVASVPIAPSDEPIFDAALKKAGLPLAPKSN